MTTMQEALAELADGCETADDVAQKLRAAGIRAASQSDGYGCPLTMWLYARASVPAGEQGRFAVDFVFAYWFPAGLGPGSHKEQHELPMVLKHFVHAMTQRGRQRYPYLLQEGAR